MKKRIYNIILINLAFVTVGVLLFVAGVLMSDSHLLVPLGAGCIASGLVKTVRMVKILKAGETKIKEFNSSYDERNTMISAKAGDLSYRLFCLLGFIVVAILALLGMEDIAMIVAYVICALLIIYVASYWYYSKKY